MNDTNIVLNGYRLANCAAFMTVYPGEDKKSAAGQPGGASDNSKGSFFLFRILLNLSYCRPHPLNHVLRQRDIANLWRNLLALV